MVKSNRVVMIALTVAGLLLLSVGFWFNWNSSSDAPQGEATDIDNAAQPVNVDLSSPIDARSPAVRRPVDPVGQLSALSGGLTIEVRSTTGAPLEGVDCFDVIDGERRYYTPSEATLLGQTGSDGSLLLGGGISDQRVGCAKVGFSTTFARVVPGATRVQVAMAHSHEHTIRFIDVGGRPVAGAISMMSKTPVAPGEHEAFVLSGADGRLACHAGVSDDAGTATVTGLDSGTYHLHLQLPVRYVPLDAPRTVAIPATVTEIRLGEVYAAVVQLAGDEILSHRFVAPSSSAANTPEISKTRSELQSKYPDSIVIVAGPPLRLQETSREIDVRFAVYVRHGGWTSFPQVKLRPAHSMEEPIRLTVDASGPDETGLLKVDVYGPKGRVSEVGRIFARMGGPGFNGFMANLTPGEFIRVPAGDYLLSSSDGALRAALSQSGALSVRRGEESSHRVDLRYQYRRVVVRVRARAGFAVANWRITAKHSDGQKVGDWWCGGGAASREVGLPEGIPLTLAVTADGFATESRQLTIESDGPREVVVEMSAQ